MHEFKSAPVSGVIVEDDGNGIITALVSVTGIVDNVKDIIVPGAYGRTLTKRKPKGIWHHTWTDPIAKTLEAEEFMPGNKGLPSKLPDGKSWPREAGALRIKMQFNLATDRGRRAYEDVKFFGAEQEWSIGYNVPVTGSRKDAKTGIRHITDIDLFEYSPVLFGAMPAARTMEGVKVAQLAFKDAMGVDYSELQDRIEEWEAAMGTKDASVAAPPAEQKPTDAFVGDEADEVDTEFDEDEDLDDFAEEDFEDEEDEDTKGVNPNTLRKAINALGDLLTELEGAEDREPPNEDSTDEKRVPIAFVEAKAAEYATVGEALDAMDEDVPQLLAASADIFDDAWLAGNKAAMDKAGATVLDQMDVWELDDEKAHLLPVLGQVMSDMYAGVNKLEGEGKSFALLGVEYKMGVSATRQLGWPVPANGVGIGRKTTQEMLLSSMDDDDLVEVADYLEDSKADRPMLRVVNRLLDERRDGESKSAVFDDSGPKEVFSTSEFKDLGLDALLK